MTIVRSTLFRCGLILATALALAPAGRAQEQKTPRPQFSEKTSEALAKLGPFMAAKPVNYAEIIKILDGALALAPAGSWDQAFLLDAKARSFAGSDQYGKAVPPWEQALAISEQHNNYFDEKQTAEIQLFLAQIIYSDATALKDKAQQAAQIQRAADYLKKYFSIAKKPAPETQLLYASILYFQATNEGKADPAKLMEARKAVEDSLLTAIHPKEGFYQLYLAILQQQNEIEKATELLELLLKQYPQKKDFWPVLAGSYLQLAQTTKQEELARSFQIRAINASERAQSLGFMQTPADNYRLVLMYLQAGQFSRGTDLLRAGLKNGKIESTAANWKLLGSYYLQANRELDSINALEEAAKLFPKDGSFDFQIAEIYRSQLSKPKEARDHYLKAIEKLKAAPDAKAAGLDKPWLTYYLLAFVDAIELENWDEALTAITDAGKYPEFIKDKQMSGLREHIEATIKAREDAKKPADAPPEAVPPAKGPAAPAPKK